MKRAYLSLLVASLGSLSGAGALQAQAVGNADPVGFVTLSVSGNAGAASAHTSYLGLGVIRPSVATGTADVVGANSITNSSASWTANQFAGTSGAYFVEVTSIAGSTTAAGVGTTYSIASNTSTTLTLATNLASGVTAPVGYKVRKQWTIPAVFGATNSSGLQGGTSSSADLVQLWNGSSLDSYYYQTAGNGGTGWRKVGDESTDASGTVIPFYSAIVVQRQQSADFTFPLSGSAKSGQTSIPVVTGDNYLGNIYPADLTLGTCGLYTGSSATGVAAGDSSSADLIQIWNGSSLDSYYYASGSSWRKVGDSSTDASNITIKAGTGFILKRQASSGFTWTVPQTFTVSPVVSTFGKAVNISTRGLIQTDDNVLIGGFIITGSVSKKVVIRAIGPSLSSSGVSGVLTDPVLELHNSSGATIASNDDWQSDAGASEIQSNSLAPSDTHESATIQTLAPGAYTAIVRGKNNSTGVGLVEVYDLNPTTDSKLANISTRGLVDSGDNVLIGGFIIGGGTSPTVVIRAIGPSLSNSGVADVLADPLLELHDANGALMISNDNWQSDASASTIAADSLAPTDTHESATLATLPSGNYTAIVRNAGTTPGLALVEVYHLD